MDSSRTKKEATEKAKQLLSKMKTKGWKIHIHENLGWHYCIFNGPLSVYPSKWKQTVSYSAMLSDDNTIGCSPSFWHTHNTFKDPNKAVEFTIKVAKEFVNKVQKIVEDTQKNLNNPFINKLSKGISIKTK